MEIGADLWLGLITAIQPANLYYCFLGVLIGTFIGVLPGIGPLTAIAMLLPITYYIEPTAAVVMLAGVYYGAEYGGSVASILVNIPGTAANAITCLDGHPMAKQGKAGVALLVTTVASFVGGSLGILLMTFVSPLLSSVGLAFGPGEYFAVILVGLVASGTIAQGAPVKGLAMIVAGLLLGTIGIDINSGIPRYSMGFYQLFEGISIAILAMGVFGVAEIIASLGGGGRIAVTDQRITLRSMLPNREDRRRSIAPTLRGSAVGSLFGALPGTGATVASIMAYAVEKRVSPEPERFGAGAVEGLASPEAANNAAAQTAFIPTLTLGIPGSATMALMLGALMIHGITPGPALMTAHPDLFWGLIVSFWIGNVLLVILNVPLIGIWVRLLRIPYHYLVPAIVCLICIGAFSIHNSVFDIWIVAILGIAGVWLRVLGFQPAPLLIGFVLGPMLEVNFRRAMLIADGDITSLFTRPISGVLMVISLAMLLWVAVTYFATLRRRTARPLAG